MNCDGVPSISSTSKLSKLNFLSEEYTISLYSFEVTTIMFEKILSCFTSSIIISSVILFNSAFTSEADSTSILPTIVEVVSVSLKIPKSTFKLVNLLAMVILEVNLLFSVSRADIFSSKGSNSALTSSKTDSA